MRQLVGSPAVVGFLLAIATWQLAASFLAPADSIDNDYRAALQWGAAGQVPFGPHFVFTYGPLGFLGFPVLYRTLPAVLSFVFLTLLRICICALVFRAVRTVAPPLLAVGLSYVVLAATAENLAVELVVPLAAAWGVRLLARPTQGRTNLEVVAAGVATAAIALMKISLGGPVFVIGLLALWGRPSSRVRPAATYALSALSAAVLLWVVTGNALTGLPSYLRVATPFITGYSAMAIETPGTTYQYLLAGAAVVIVVGLAYARGSSSGGRRAGAALAAGALIGLEVVFRESFERHDSHDVLFFSAVVVFVVAYWPPDLRLSRLALPAILVAAAGAQALVVGGVPTAVLKPHAAIGNWARSVADLAVASRRTDLESSARATLRAEYGIPPAWIAEIAGDRVATVPLGQPVWWVYPSLRWEPLPTIQEYTAYTRALDSLDADFLQGPQAPGWVLLQRTAIDGRNPVWESPQAAVALRCNYRVVATGQAFTLLRHTATVCGRPQPLLALRPKLGTVVQVPTTRPGSAVVASIEVGPSMLGRFADLAFKGATYSVIVNGHTAYRFVEGTGGGPHLLRFPLDGDTSLSVAPVRTLEVVSHDPWASADHAVIRFASFPVAP